MKYTDNIIQSSAFAESRQARWHKMNSIYASNLIKQVFLHDFTEHFKSDTTKASYKTDITEIMEYFQKDFLKIRNVEVQEYFEWMKHRVEAGIISPSTMTKKFRELHSFADYLCENREKYGIEEAYQDEYYPYLKLVAKQDKFAKSIPIEHLDKLLSAAQADMMAYCILILLYRVGLSSTEIMEIKPDDLAYYEEGLYIDVEKRRAPCYVPEDTADILERYMEERRECPYLFYNKRGNQLNTMYISRMMKKYTTEAGIPNYSAESIRNACGVTLFAYGGNEKQVANQLGITRTQIKRYKNMRYRDELQIQACKLVKLRVDPPVS